MIPDYVKKEKWSEVRVKSSFSEGRSHDIIVGRINNSPQEFELRVSRIPKGKPKICLSVINCGDDRGALPNVKLFEKAAYGPIGHYSDHLIDFMDSDEAKLAISLVNFYVDDVKRRHVNSIDKIRKEGLRAAGLRNEV